jgi:hypothetical protein
MKLVMVITPIVGLAAVILKNGLACFLVGGVKAWLGVPFVIAILSMGIINGAAMSISPRSWFELPAWFRAQGSLTPEKNLKGWGAFQVRFIGAGTLAVTSFMFYQLLDLCR